MKIDSEVIITEHAKDRMISRLGLNKKSLLRIATKAYNEGLSHNQVKGRLRKYIDGLWFHGDGKANNIKIYGDKAYLFKGNLLITVIQVPNNLTRELKNMVEK